MSSHGFCGLGVWPWLSGDFAVKGLPGLSASLRLSWGKDLLQVPAWWSAAFSCFSAVSLGPWFFAGVGWRAPSAPCHVVLTGVLPAWQLASSSQPRRVSPHTADTETVYCVIMCLWSWPCCHPAHAWMVGSKSQVLPTLWAGEGISRDLSTQRQW